MWKIQSKSNKLQTSYYQMQNIPIKISADVWQHSLLRCRRLLFLRLVRTCDCRSAGNSGKCRQKHLHMALWAFHSRNQNQLKALDPQSLNISCYKSGHFLYQQKTFQAVTVNFNPLSSDVWSAQDIYSNFSKPYSRFQIRTLFAMPARKRCLIIVSLSNPPSPSPVWSTSTYDVKHA